MLKRQARGKEMNYDATKMYCIHCGCITNNESRQGYGFGRCATCDWRMKREHGRDAAVPMNPKTGRPFAETSGIMRLHHENMPTGLRHAAISTGMAHHEATYGWRTECYRAEAYVAIS